MEERMKVLYKLVGEDSLRVFKWDEFEDDKQNKRIVFHNIEEEKVLTIYTDNLQYMITAPYRDGE